MDKITKIFLYFSTISISFLSALAIARQFYENFWWFDIPMHILGGAWVAFIFFYFFFHKKNIFNKDISLAETVIVILGFVALIGALWEIYEFMISYLFSVNFSLPNWYEMNRHGQTAIFDTIKDLINDLFGGLIATTIFYLTNKK